MKNYFTKIIEGIAGLVTNIFAIVSFVIWGAATYLLYKLPVIIGLSDSPSRILGLIGFVLGLRLAMKVVR